MLHDLQNAGAMVRLGPWKDILFATNAFSTTDIDLAIAPFDLVDVGISSPAELLGPFLLIPRASGAADCSLIDWFFVGVSLNQVDSIICQRPKVNNDVFRQFRDTFVLIYC